MDTFSKRQGINVFKVKYYDNDITGRAEKGRDWANNTAVRFDESLKNINKNNSVGGLSSLGSIIIVAIFGYCFFTNGNKAVDHHDNLSNKESIKTKSTSDYTIQQPQLRVRKCSSKKSNELFKVDQGERVTVLEDAGGGWYKIQARDQIGYANLLVTK